MLQDLSQQVETENQNKFNGVKIIDKKQNQALKADIESNLSKMENQIIYKSIEKFDNKIRKEIGIVHMMPKVYNRMGSNFNSEEGNFKLGANKKKNKEVKKNLEICQKNVDELMKAMKISSINKIVPTYLKLEQDKNEVDSIIEGYKEQIQEAERSLKIQKQRNNMISKREIITESNFSDINICMNNTSMENIYSNIAKIEVTSVNDREKDLIKAQGELLNHKLEHEKISKSLQNACLTISRIMYQTGSKDQDKTVEINRSNIVDYLSYLGLKLERMLSFAQTRSKTYKNDENLVIGMINREEMRKAGKLQPPGFLGLNKPVNNPVRFLEDNSQSEQDTYEGEDKNWNDTSQFGSSLDNNE